MSSWNVLFPPGARVIALPSWRSPRVFIQAQSVGQRWAGSRLFPAFRWRARMAKQVLRLFVAAGLVGKSRTAMGDKWLVRDFLGEKLPTLTGVNVIKGTPGPAEKTVVQLVGSDGSVIGYLKFAEKPAGLARVKHEEQMLTNLPNSVGPDLIASGEFGSGYALVVSPITGSQVTPTIPPPDALQRFVRKLDRGSSSPIDTHPYVLANPRIGDVDNLVEMLRGRDWPVVLRHGDLSWNLMQPNDADPSAIDWEYGLEECLPCFDVATYVLQTSFLIYKWTPEKALAAAVRAVIDSGPEMSETEATALVKLAAYQNYLDFSSDGQPEDDEMQLWRWKIIKSNET